MIAKIIDDDNRIGDGRSMGNEVLSGVEADTGGLLLDKGSAKALKSSPPSLSGGIEKITVALDEDIDADAVVAPCRWRFLVNAWVVSDCRPIVRISDQAKRKTPYRSMII
jgi:hypothetical protein